MKVHSDPLMPPPLQRFLLPALGILLLLLAFLLRPQLAMSDSQVCTGVTPTPLVGVSPNETIDRTLCLEEKGIGQTAFKIDETTVMPVATNQSTDKLRTLYTIPASSGARIAVKRTVLGWGPTDIATSVPISTRQAAISNLKVDPDSVFCGTYTDIDLSVNLDGPIEDETRLVIKYSGTAIPFNRAVDNVYRAKHSLTHQDLACNELFSKDEITYEASVDGTTSFGQIAVEPPKCTVHVNTEAFENPLTADSHRTKRSFSRPEAVYILSNLYRYGGVDWAKIKSDQTSDAEWILFSDPSCPPALADALRGKRFLPVDTFEQPSPTPAPATPLPLPTATTAPPPTPTPFLPSSAINSAWKVGFRHIDPASDKCQLDGEGFTQIDGIWLFNEETGKKDGLNAEQGVIGKTVRGEIVITTVPCSIRSQYRILVQEKGKDDPTIVGIPDVQ